MKQTNKDFDEFIGNLRFAYQQFCLSVELEKKFSGTRITQKYQLYWFTIRVALMRGYLAELAKLFEKQNSKFNDVLSIYYLMDIEFKEHEKTILKLKKLRDKFLMHHDLNTSREFDAFIKKLNLSPKDTQDLFIKVFEVLERLKPNYCLSGEISSQFNFIEKKIEKETKEVLTKLEPEK